MLVLPRHCVVLLSIVATQLTIYLSAPSFYGITLTKLVLQQIGFAGKKGTPWERLFQSQHWKPHHYCLGFVPGKYISVTRSRLRIRTDMRQEYYVTVLTIEKLGRNGSRFQGFLLAALFRQWFFFCIFTFGMHLTKA